MKQTSKSPKLQYELDAEECAQLFKEAEAVIDNTYPKTRSGFSVAVLTKAGNMYQGISYQSDTLSLTMHSEAVALANAALHGETEIVAITGPNCHICKQLIYESGLRSGIDTVVLVKEDNQIKQIPISEMMPYAWPEVSKL